MDRQPANCCGARVDCAGCEVRPLAVCGALAPADVLVMGSIAHPRKLDAGKQLIQEGDPADDVFTLTDGMLKLYKLMPDGRRQITGFMIPGDFIGLAYGQSYVYSAEAVTPATACRFKRSARRKAAAAWCRSIRRQAPPKDWPKRLGGEIFRLHRPLCIPKSAFTTSHTPAPWMPSPFAAASPT